MNSSNYEETLKWYQKHAAEYALKTTQSSKIDQGQLVEFSTYLPSGAKVIDAGCGAGRDANLFHEMGFAVVGVDLSTELLAEATRRYPNVSFKEGDLLSLPFEDELFDGVWAHASLVHFETIQQVEKSVSELWRVAKKGAICHLLVRAHDLKKQEIRSDSIAGSDRYYRYFTENETESMITNAGFSVLKILRYTESDLDAQKRPADDIEWILVLARK